MKRPTPRAQRHRYDRIDAIALLDETRLLDKEPPPAPVVRSIGPFRLGREAQCIADIRPH